MCNVSGLRPWRLTAVRGVARQAPSRPLPEPLAQQVLTRGLALLIVGRVTGDGRPAKRPDLLPYEGPAGGAGPLGGPGPTGRRADGLTSRDAPGRRHQVRG
ncbi:hypothetical protein GCM10010145_55490 [Streptomyces ruber]|uniref:Uncharacterized protein n=2 Tax=Streptomyces TaxID=1883 RepID=A0A918EY00_9ACTN|nr:hypothetical protein GCM10010145_55490 [Streptomyces ruber]